MAQTEVRVALVLNGGVSLAVWMGGVAHEIDLLRRASAGVLPPPEGSPDRGVYDAWQRLCGERQVRVVVDVVAGTSAGGLNGALLATAIGRGAPLPDVRSVWRETAQLAAGRLLPEDGPSPLPSVLDGDFFADRAADVFGAIQLGEARDPVTLFVTATALGRHEVRVVDSYGSAFPVPDHRRLYRFRYDPSNRQMSSVEGALPDDVRELFPVQVQDEIGPEATPRLARAARASAGFPVAFAPVRESDDDVDLVPCRVRGAGAAWLVDGGVLDNAPFDPVLGEIAARPVDRPWRRVLAYVVPAGGEPTVDAEAGERPGWLPVLGAALRLPAEADLRGDIERLTELSAAAGRWTQQPQELFGQLRAGGPGTGTDELVAAAEALLAPYRQSRVDSGVASALWTWAGASERRPLTVGRTEQADPDRAEGWVPPGDWAAATTGSPWAWGTAVADRLVRLFLRDLARRADPPRDGLVDLSDYVACVQALRDEVEAHLASSAPVQPSVGLALNAVNEAIRATDSPRLLDALLRAASRAYLRHTGGDEADVERVLRDGLVVEVLTRAFAGGERFSRSVALDVVHLGPDIDSPVVPSVAGPADVSPRPLGAWKLWGTQLGHFGAFGRTEWRMDDWLWGRLDGVAHLVRIVDQACGDDCDVRADTADLQQAVLDAAGTTAERVREGLRTTLGHDARSVLAELRSTERGRDESQNAVGAVLRTLRARGGGVKPVVSTAGDWLSVVLARERSQDLSDEFPEDVAALAASPVRKRFWKAVRGDD